MDVELAEGQDWESLGKETEDKEQLSKETGTEIGGETETETGCPEGHAGYGNWSQMGQKGPRLGEMGRRVCVHQIILHFRAWNRTQDSCLSPFLCHLLISVKSTDKVSHTMLVLIHTEDDNLLLLSVSPLVQVTGLCGGSIDSNPAEPCGYQYDAT